ncbi:hypothetical protein EON65_00430 [archaeon]|nr:MAG: hypothetical protein EON65_00430 [archaeon]
MDQQVKNAIRHLVFTFLEQNSSDLQCIKWKDLRGFIEVELRLPGSTCKTEPYKGMISTYINRFLQVKNSCEDIRIIQSGGAPESQSQSNQHNASAEAVKIVKGRFTKKEVEKVLEAVKEFCEQEGVTSQDLINFYHGSGKAPVKTKKWVGFIRQRLPYRDPEVRPYHTYSTHFLYIIY